MFHRIGGHNVDLRSLTENQLQVLIDSNRSTQRRLNEELESLIGEALRRQHPSYARRRGLHVVK